MRTKHLLLLVLVNLSIGLFGQTASDPLDFFYTDLVIWETAGLIGNLPAASPYPLQIVKKILQTVIENGNSTDRKMAEAHYRRIFGRTVTVGVKSDLATETDNLQKQLGMALSLDMNYEIAPFASISASLDGWAVNKLPDNELLPAWETSKKDLVKDNANVGSFNLLPSLNSSISFGNTEYYLNAGLMRGTFGPFRSYGVVVNPGAMHSGQYSIAVNKSTWGYNFSLFSLSASNLKGKWFPDKYLAVHSFDYHPFEWLSVSFLESVLYGGRQELLYFLPVSSFMISQGLTGFKDNCYIGGMFTVKPVDGVKIDGVLYADDLSLNDMVRLDFDTKWQLAGQLGASFTPKKSGIFTLASADYTMVTPYTYAHKESNELDKNAPNYLNYQHAGNSLGAALDPNSDRLTLNIKLRPLEGIDFDLVGTLIRHGNVNETIGFKYVKEYLTQDKYITDGSILNSAKTDSGHAYQETTPFLTQKTIQYIWQTGFNALCRLPVLKSGGYMVFRFGYRLECNINENIDKTLYSYDTVNLVYNAEGEVTSSDAVIRSLARSQLSAWRDAAKGINFNNFISAGFEYFY